MEARLNKSAVQKSLLTAAMIFILATGYGCAHGKKTFSSGKESGAGGEVYGPHEEPMGPSEAYGPPAPEAAQVYGPEAVQIKPIVLVLGPGLARDFAASGIFHALRDAKIPVGAIFASEFGSLVAALYAVDGNLNHFDWQLLHFKDAVFVDQGGMISKLLSKPADSEKLDSAIETAFGSKDLSQTKIPLHIVLRPSASKNAVVVEKGKLSEAVRAAIAVPELYAPGKWEGAAAVSARDTLPFAVAEARGLNWGPVVVVDTLEKKDLARLGVEFKDADLVLEPDLTGIGGLDFNRRTEAAFRGKAAVIQKLAELKHLVGLPEFDSDRLTTTSEGTHP